MVRCVEPVCCYRVLFLDRKKNALLCWRGARDQVPGRPVHIRMCLVRGVFPGDLPDIGVHQGLIIQRRDT